MRSFLPPLLVCALARGDLGVDFDNTDYEFLESVPFLAVLLLLNVVGALSDRLTPAPAVEYSLFAVACVLGALLFAGSLEEEGYSGFPGWIAGVACVTIAFLAARTFLDRARSRLAARGDEESAGFLTLYVDGAALLLAALAVFVPPVSYVALAFCAWALIEQRRRSGKKYEGLRVLR
jgi:hypothetical protein